MPRLRSVPVIDTGPCVLEIAPPVSAVSIPCGVAEDFGIRLLHALHRATRDTAVRTRVARPTRLELLVSLEDSGKRGTSLLRNARTSQVVWSSAFTSDDLGTQRIARAIRFTLNDIEARSPQEPSAESARAWATLWARPQSAESNGSVLRRIHSARREIDSSPRWLTLNGYAHWRAARFGWNGVTRAKGLQVALDASERALQLDPGHVDARFVLAMTHLELGDLELGISGLEQAAQLDPSHGPAVGNLGHANMIRGAYREAFAYCGRAIAISAEEPLAALWYGSHSFIHSITGDPRSAISSALAAVLSNPKHRFGLLALAVARESEGDTQAVRRVVERIRSLPDSAFMGPLDMPGYALCKGPFSEQASVFMERLRAALAPHRVVRHTDGRLRVFTLGRFCIERADRPITWGRKPPQMLIRLLKVLVAFGGRDVEVARITDALWPDEAGGAVRRRLDTALYRFRTLLGADVLRVNGSIVSLNAETIDVDAIAFRDGGSVSLYTGPFLPGDLDAAWSVPMRETLAERFRSEVARSAERLLERGHAEEALTTCAKAMAVEPASEVLCRLALRACLTAGRRDEGQRLYALHATALQREFDLIPDAQTRSLHTALTTERKLAYRGT